MSPILNCVRHGHKVAIDIISNLLANEIPIRGSKSSTQLAMAVLFVVYLPYMLTTGFYFFLTKSGIEVLLPTFVLSLVNKIGCRVSFFPKSGTSLPHISGRTSVRLPTLTNGVPTTTVPAADDTVIGNNVSQGYNGLSCTHGPYTMLTF
jgi:hypothetical protein